MKERDEMFPDDDSEVTPKVADAASGRSSREVLIVGDLQLNAVA